MKTTRTESPTVIAARAELAAADSALERLALATSRPGRVVTAEQADRDRARGEELLARCVAADAALKAALATDAEVSAFQDLDALADSWRARGTEWPSTAARRAVDSAVTEQRAGIDPTAYVTEW